VLARLLALAALLALSACEDAPPAPAPAKAQGACESRSFEGSTFTVCTYDARTDELRLVLNGADGRPLRSLAGLEAALGPDVPRVRFAMNAGMYDDEGDAIGLYVEDGKPLAKLNLNAGPGNFHLLPNGVFAADAAGRVSVTPSPAFAKLKAKPLWATQSGPMLVIGGKLHPKFDADGPSQLVRNGVGVKDARTAYFVISDFGVSFGRFARFFRDVLGCPDALYFDGTVSSLWDPAAGRQDPYPNLGPMLVVLRKASAPRP
jgi:uncharacterized protein YigE (DUF2233 family)